MAGNAGVSFPLCSVIARVRVHKYILLVMREFVLEMLIGTFIGVTLVG